MYVDIHENVYESNIIYIYIYYNIYCVGARKLSKSNNTMYICACVLLHKCTFTMYMCIYYFFSSLITSFSNVYCVKRFFPSASSQTSIHIHMYQAHTYILCKYMCTNVYVCVNIHVLYIFEND